MATTIFENIVDSNFGDKGSSKGVSFGQKQILLNFDLVKDKTSKSKIDYSKSGVKTKGESDRVAESLSTKSSGDQRASS